MSKYKVNEPSALKFLKANGAVVDENGNVVNEATDYWKKVYEQAEPKVAKYLHADGTIDENPGGSGGGADLEDNKTATIDVSTYTEPVEIEPTAGKDGMKKATVTLSNIPSGGGYNFYGWKNFNTDDIYYTLTETPTVNNKAYMSGFRCGKNYTSENITSVGEGPHGSSAITVNGVSYTRDTDADFSLTV